MKKLLLALLLAASPALAQDGPNHSVPIFGGPGFVGFRTVGPCLSTQSLSWASGVGADPSCINNLPASGIDWSGNPPISKTFQGNGGAGFFWESILSTTQSATANEWIAQFAMVGSTGSANHTTATKGGIYAHCILNAGSGDCFGANFIGQASSGGPAGSNVTGLEVDVNNHLQNYGESGFRYNVAGPAQNYGVTIASSSVNNGTTDFRSTAGLYVTALAAPTGLGLGAWNRGAAFDQGCCAQATIEDGSSATISYKMTGTHTTGIDAGGATLTTSMVLPNNAPIVQKDSGGTARNIINLTSSNSVNVGDGVHNTFIVGGAGITFAPNTDNQTALGGASNRWSSLFVNGCTIASSADSNFSCTSATTFRPAPQFTNTTSDASYSNLAFQKSRSGGAVNNADGLGALVVQGFANAAFNNSAQIIANVAAAPSGSNVPSKWQFQTSNAAGQLNQGLTFDNNAHLGVTAQATAPTITAGCNGAGSSVGTGSSDYAGNITGQTAAATTCTITFGTAFTNTPSCVTSGDQSAILTQTRATGTLVVTFASTANFRFNWICSGV